MRWSLLVIALSIPARAHADNPVEPSDTPPSYAPDPPPAQWLQPWTFGVTSMMAGPLLGKTFGVTAEYAPRHWFAFDGMVGGDGLAPAGAIGAKLRAVLGGWALSGHVGLMGVGARAATDDRSNFLSGTDVLAYNFDPELLGTGEIALEIRGKGGFGARFGVGFAAPLAGGSYRCTETAVANGVLDGVVDGLVDGIAGTIGATGPTPDATSRGDCSGHGSTQVYGGVSVTYTPRLRSVPRE